MSFRLIFQGYFMRQKAEALKTFAVALGFGKLEDYTGDTSAMVLKQMAVKMGCASTVNDIEANTTTGVLNFIADNYGNKEKDFTTKHKGKATA